MNNEPELPDRSTRHSHGERGIAILKVKLPTPWILRNQVESDYGVDVEIELADTRVLGIIFKAQVRTKTPIRWRSDATFREPFDSGKLFYWRSISLPVVLFLVDNEKEEVYWEPASGAIPADPKLPDALVIKRSNSIKDTLGALVDYVTNFRSYPDSRKLLYRLPFFMRMWEHRKGELDYDRPMPLELDDYSEVQYIYEEITDIRTALGLSNLGMVPWQIWLVRSTSIFGDSGELHNGVHDEVIAYLEPLVSEAFSVAKRLLADEEINTLNVTLKNKFEEDSRVSYSCPSIANLPFEFWEAFERDLEKRDAKLFNLAKVTKDLGHQER